MSLRNQTALCSVLGLFLGILVPSVLEASTIRTPHYQHRQLPGNAEYRRGVEALANEDFWEAEKAFEKVLVDFPHHVEALIGLAEIAMKRRNAFQVEKRLKQALAVAPQNAALQQTWGRYLVTRGQLLEAELAFRKGIELEPKLISLYQDLGDVYLRSLGQPHKAIAIYQTAVQLDPSQGELYYSLGTAFVTIGELEQAEVAFEQASRLSPSNPLPFHSLGRLMAVQKKYTQAIKNFSKALEAKPHFFQAYVYRGDVYVIEEDDRLALEDYQSALNIIPSSGPVYVKVGLLHERNHRLDEAVKAFRSAIDLDPKQSIAYNNLAWISAQEQTRLDEALGWAQKAVELSPHTTAFLDTLGWVHRARGELTEAATVLQQASAQDPEIPEVLYHLGVVREEQGNYNKASDAFKNALSLKKDFAEAEDARIRLKRLEIP